MTGSQKSGGAHDLLGPWETPDVLYAGGLVGLAGFLIIRVTTRIISTTCSPVSGLLWTVGCFLFFLGVLAVARVVFLLLSSRASLAAPKNWFKLCARI